MSRKRPIEIPAPRVRPKPQPPMPAELKHALERIEFRIKRSEKRANAKFIHIERQLVALLKKFGNPADLQRLVDQIHQVDDDLAESTAKMKDAVQPAEG